MKYAEIPARVWPMVLDKDRVRGMEPVTSLDIYDGASNDFHDEGLYSTRIFGRVGSDQRDYLFSYIDVKVMILHPKIYRELIGLKGIYKGIISGRERAVFDPVSKDFYADNGPNADTGYAFFMKHFQEMQFRKSKSPTRTLSIELVDRYRKTALTRYIPVIPAGLRDIEINDNGSVTKNEIHDLYYRALSISNTIPVSSDMESPALDVARFALTSTLLDIYEMIEGMIEGKNGFLLNKWASRRVAYGTRNVLSVMDTSIANLSDKNSPGFDSTSLGLFQVAKGITPITIHHMRRLYGHVVSSDEGQARLINKKTLKAEWVTLSPDARDLWTTKDGLSSIIDQYGLVDNRNRPVEIEGYYMALIYKGPDNTFKIFYDIDELPKHLDKKYVKPITQAEMLYLAAYSKWNQYCVQITRYPISGTGSIYPSRVYVKTTIVGEQRRELGMDWQPLEGDEFLALEFPQEGSTSYMDTQSPHSTKLQQLQADFDGDTGSATFVMTNEALDENRRHLASRKTWIKTDGSLGASFDYDTINYVLTNMTGRFKHDGYGPVRSLQ